MDLEDRGLKHYAFFAATGSLVEGTREASIATSGLMMMRLIDHWILVGPEMVALESVSVRSNRDLAMAIPEASPYRRLTLGIINEMQQSREPDIESILPRLAEYAALLGEEPWSEPLAEDVRYTIDRLQRTLNAEDELVALLEEAARLIEEQEKADAAKQAKKKAKPKPKKRKKKPGE